jgi:hypothetical protein
MCIIFACWSGLPNDKELEVSAKKNDDGAGICWVNLKEKERRTRWIKGLDSTVVAVKNAIKVNKIPFPLAIHYRSASIGPKCEELTHPFPIAHDGYTNEVGDERSVLMHNGHIGDWKTWLFKVLVNSKHEFPNGPWSDSRGLAIAAAIKGEGILPFIEQSSRILVMDSIASEGHDKKLPGSYMRMFGLGWEYHKNRGFATSCAIPFPATTQKGWHDTRRSTKASRRAARKGMEGRDGSVYTPPVEPSGATYSVEELEAIVAEVQGEQRAAQLLLGVGH